VSWYLHEGDALTCLREMPAGSVQTCVTSPPYWGLRDYGAEGQLGLEPTPEQYVANLVAVFREVKRVLRDDGTLWLNLGDSFCSTAPGTRVDPGAMTGKHVNEGAYRRAATPLGLKPKDLVGIPWMVAFALRADGWYLRSDIIWAKPNPMPESVTDRPTKAHEYLFLLSKSPRYFYDADAVREPSDRPDLIGRATRNMGPQEKTGGVNGGPNLRNDSDRVGVDYCNPAGRNKRSVWTVATQPFPGSHFAVFPPKLIEPCVLAGSLPATSDFSIQTRDGLPQSTVLDPFAGAGTTGVVALRHDRGFIGIELNPEYAEMARNRIRDDAPLMNVGAEAA